jgi:3D (Asp-Asp-Asp) domain-containing protein
VEVEPVEVKSVPTTEPQLISLGTFRLTAFCNCSKCNGKWAGGPTASGTMPMAGRTIAVDKAVIPLGAEVIINGHTYIAEDTGGKWIQGKEIDIFFDSHQKALEFGVKYMEVFVYASK